MKINKKIIAIIEDKEQIDDILLNYSISQGSLYFGSYINLIFNIKKYFPNLDMRSVDTKFKFNGHHIIINSKKIKKLKNVIISINDENVVRKLVALYDEARFWSMPKNIIEFWRTVAELIPNITFDANNTRVFFDGDCIIFTKASKIGLLFSDRGILKNKYI